MHPQPEVKHVQSLRMEENDLNSFPLESDHTWNNFCGVKLNFLCRLVFLSIYLSKFSPKGACILRTLDKEKIASAISFYGEKN